jgi:rhodanese-related sulfurtransferase
LDSKFDHSNLSASDLNVLLTQQTDTVLMDLFSSEHFVKRDIPGARNACIFQVSFLDDLSIIAPDKSVAIVVYGASERSQDAAMAKVKLDRAGYENVSFFEGGLEA